MAPDDARVRRLLDRSMTMRVATLSPGGVPHITPLRFLYDGGTIHALPGADTPMVRHIREQPDVVLLFDAEQTTGRVLRVRAHATIRSDLHLTRRYERRAATKYFLRPGGIWNTLTHGRLFLGGRRRLRRDNALIEFVPRTVELVPRPSDEDRAKKAGMVGVASTVTSRRRSPLKFSC